MKRLIALAVINEMLPAANVLLSLMVRMKIKRKQPAPVSIKVTKMPLGDHPQAASASAELSSYTLKITTPTLESCCSQLYIQCCHTD